MQQGCEMQGLYGRLAFMDSMPNYTHGMFLEDTQEAFDVTHN